MLALINELSINENKISLKPQLQRNNNVHAKTVASDKNISVFIKRPEKSAVFAPVFKDKVIPKPLHSYVRRPWFVKPEAYNQYMKDKVMDNLQKEVGMSQASFYVKLGKRGVKDAWCAYFLSSAYEEAIGKAPWGYKNKDEYLSFVTEIRDWSKKAGNYNAVNHSNRNQELKKLQRGDFLYFKYPHKINGITHTGNHIAVVDKILKNGSIITIEGNTRVTNVDPYLVSSKNKITKKPANYKKEVPSQNRVMKKLYVPGSYTYSSIVGFTHINDLTKF